MGNEKTWGVNVSWSSVFDDHMDARPRIVKILGNWDHILLCVMKSSFGDFFLNFILRSFVYLQPLFWGNMHLIAYLTILLIYLSNPSKSTQVVPDEWALPKPAALPVFPVFVKDAIYHLLSTPSSLYPVPCLHTHAITKSTLLIQSDTLILFCSHCFLSRFGAALVDE